MNPVLLHLMVVVFAATVIQSALGFGEALIAVPLLAFRIPVEVAAPLVVLISITVAVVVVTQDWRRIHVDSARWLLIATVFGVPLGLLCLKLASDRAAKVVLGTIIVAFSLYALMWRQRVHLKSDSRLWLLGCGLVAGIMAGAYGLSGPPLVMYGTMRRWSPQHFRATLQGYFLPSSLIIMGAYWLVGRWTPAVTRYYLLSLPVTLAAIVLGRALNNRLKGEAFTRYVYLMLVGIGVMLLLQAVRT